MGKKPVALFIGRFQPFHLGHLQALRWIAAQSSKVIVAVGSADKALEPENPFSARERIGMIRAEIGKEGYGKRCIVVPLTDVDDNSRWVAHVDAHVPHYDVAYSNNPLVRRLMRKAGKKVRAIPFFRRRILDATKIRRRMAEGKEWEDRVPEKVAEQLKKMDAARRLRAIRASRS